MKVFNCAFEDFPSLIKHLENHNFFSEPNLLIQFFDGRNDELLFQEMAETLSSLFPQATVLGVTTAGEILDGKMLENSVSLSFCAFTCTKLIPLYSPTCDFQGGEAVIHSLPKEGIKAAIFFSEGLQGAPKSF